MTHFDTFLINMTLIKIITATRSPVTESPHQDTLKFAMTARGVAALGLTCRFASRRQLKIGGDRKPPRQAHETAEITCNRSLASLRQDPIGAHIHLIEAAGYAARSHSPRRPRRQTGGGGSSLQLPAACVSSQDAPSSPPSLCANGSTVPPSIYGQSPMATFFPLSAMFAPFDAAPNSYMAFNPDPAAQAPSPYSHGVMVRLRRHSYP